MKNFIILLILFLLASINFISCREKDDRDIIIAFLKIAENGDFSKLDPLISVKYREKTRIISHTHMLIEDLKYNDLPLKAEIKQIITTPEYPGYSFLLKPNNIEYMISLDKTKRPIQILHLTRIGEIIPNKKLEFVD